jgi:hypothetical protein
MADDLDARAAKLKQQVLERARWYLTPPRFDGGPEYRDQARTWVEALERAATDLCDGWHWLVQEFITTEAENAHFVLQQYHGERDRYAPWEGPRYGR